MPKRLQNQTTTEDVMPHDYVAVAWGAAKLILRRGLRDLLRDIGLWDDFKQEVFLCAFIAQQNQYTYRETCRFTQREIYRALREYGFRKPENRGEYVRDVVTETEFVDDTTENKPLFERLDTTPHHKQLAVIVIDGGDEE